MGERTWNVGDRVIVLSDEENSGQARHTNRTGKVVEINPADLRGWHFGVRFDGDSPDAKPSWFAGNELAPAPPRPVIEVWEWKDAPEAWRALWLDRCARHPELLVSRCGFYEYGPHLAVVSRPGCEVYATQALDGLDVDGWHTFQLPDGDRLDVIVAEQAEERS